LAQALNAGGQYPTFFGRYFRSLLNLRTWLTAYLQACADNGNAPPVDINAFLPWQMDAKRLAQMRACHPQEIHDSS